MKMRISDLSRMTGLSASGIRFYEQVGMIAPQRQKNGKYREFNLNELTRLLTSKNYQKYGFSFKETSDLINESDEGNLITQFKRRSENLHKEINEKQLLIEYINNQIEAIEFAQSNPDTCIMKSSPAYYWVKLWQPDKESADCLPEEEAQEWLEYLPFVESCPLFDPLDIMEKDGIIESEWGLSIKEDHIQPIDFFPKTIGEYLPSKPCIYTAIESNDQMTLHSQQLSYVRKYLSEKHLQISDRVISRRIYNINDNHQFRRFDHLWIPVKKEP